MRLAVAGFALLALLTVGQTSQADDHKVGDLTIVHPVARPTMGVAANSVVYLTIRNEGEADVLIDVDGPEAESVSLHTSIMEDGIMTMRPLDNGLEIPANGDVELVSGGHHVMLRGLAEPLEYGDQFKMTLVFEKAGRIEVDVFVVHLENLGGEMDHD